MAPGVRFPVQMALLPTDAGSGRAPGSSLPNRSARWRPPASGLIRGCWQLARGHGPGWTRERAFAVLDAAAARSGRLRLDVADIYTGAEELIGAWIASRGLTDAEVRIHTKFVPDLDALPHTGRDQVRAAAFRSRDRLGVEALELVQLHWWDLAVPGWVRTAEWLAELRDEGVIRHLGVTNVGRRALAALLGAGIPVATNQVQLSLLDRRPLAGLAALCRERGVALLCYGTLAGGLLAVESPAGASPWAATNEAEPRASRSLDKYRLIAEEVGGTGVLARAREALARVASRHGVAAADVAAAYALAQDAAGAVIVGLSRRGLGVDPVAVRLAAGEIAELEAAVPRTVAGGVYEIERRRDGPHGRIMRYNLNRAGAGVSKKGPSGA